MCMLCQYTRPRDARGGYRVECYNIMASKQTWFENIYRKKKEIK